MHSSYKSHNKTYRSVRPDQPTEVHYVAVRFAVIPIVLFNVFDNVDSSGLQSMLEEVFECQDLVVWIMGAVVDDKVQIPCIILRPNNHSFIQSY